MAGTHLTGEADTAQEPRPGDCFPAQGKRKQSEMSLTALFWVSSGILTHFPAKRNTPDDDSYTHRHYKKYRFSSLMVLFPFSAPF